MPQGFDGDVMEHIRKRAGADGSAVLELDALVPELAAELNSGRAAVMTAIQRLAITRHVAIQTRGSKRFLRIFGITPLTMILDGIKMPGDEGAKP